jgi:hypothetical protein
MTPEQLDQLRELLTEVRHWRTGIDEALDRVDVLVGGVDAPPPDQTGTPLPEPSTGTIHAVEEHLTAALDLLHGTAQDT